MKFYHNNIKVFILSCLLPVLLLLPLVVSSGCSGSYRDEPRLRNIGTKLSDRSLSSSEALPLLDSLEKIPDKDLSEGERHYRDFLAIKAADKGYVKHTSDSLYLTVKDYFSSRHSRDMLPEVLYYGGRVYSDMGNYPVALQYFQEALDGMEGRQENLYLKRCVLSQTGGLLSKLGIYDDALKYTEECLRLDECSADTLNHIYNLELAADISIRLKDYRKAQVYLEDACRLSRGKHPDEYALNRFSIGNVAHKQRNTKKALPIMRETMNHVDSARRNYVLPIAAQVYLDAGIADTAYMYACELISNDNPLNKKFGYRILLSKDMRGRISSDTIARYLNSYDKILGKSLDDAMKEAALMQNTLYNYSVHDRQRQKAEKERDRIKLWLATALAILGALASVIIFYAFKREKRINFIFRLRAKSGFVKNIILSDQCRIGSSAEESKRGSGFEEILTEAGHSDQDLKDGREKLRQEILLLCGQKKDKERFISLYLSEPYIEIHERIKKGEEIKVDDPLWDTLSNTVKEIFPNFHRNLRILTDGMLSLMEEHTALLVKCGFGVRDMGIVFARSKSAITSRRQEIAKKIYGEKKTSEEIVRLIRSL